LSALSLGASALVVARWAPEVQLRSRLGFLFGGLCLFYAARAASVALNSDALDLLQRVVACVMPLAALLLVEGVLRRHAPRALKAFVTLGAFIVAIALFTKDGRPAVIAWGLATFVILSLVSATALLIFRDRKSLSRQENAGLDALAVPGALLAIVAITDFRELVPLGLSGLGATMVAFVIGANPSSRREAQRVLAELLLMGVVAGSGAVAFAAVLGLQTPDEEFRMGAVLFALLLATGAVLRASQAGPGLAAQSFARALTEADTASLDGFLNSLADQPLLAGLRLAEGAQLAEYDEASLGTALAARPVWTQAVLRDAETPAPVRAREELGDLMTRTEATHAVMISRAPLRIALLILPGGSQSDDAETDLALFGKLAAMAAIERACV
jgi:hypothetical protein